jgi:hypothetical protein
MIRLLEVENNVVKPTEHCQIIKWLKVIQDKWPEHYVQIYAYIFYMSCPSQENPYFNVPFDLREETCIQDVDLPEDFDFEADEIIEAIEKATVLYETPTIRAYKGITTMLDNLTEYMETTKVTAGRDGNINSLLRIAKEFDAIRQSYKGIAKDLEAEQQTIVRGGQNLAYDQ